MKIRSQNELQDFLDKTFAPRKREITTYKFIISQCKREHEKNALFRAAIPLLYSHWEGYIKYSSIAYLSYISNMKILLKNLKTNIVAVAFREKIIAGVNSKKTKIHEELVNFIFENIEHSLTFEPESAINTESNLNSDVLQSIMQTVGLEFSDEWKKKINVIDQKLLKHRNEIAHGELVPIDIVLYEQLHDFVLKSLEEYKTAIENAASTSLFLKN